MSLVNAEYAWAALSPGRPLGRSLAIVAEIELRALAELASAASILVDAYRGIQSVALGGELQLDGARLADDVRGLRLAQQEAALMGDHLFLGRENG
jgi:hypothetical protein